MGLENRQLGVPFALYQQIHRALLSFDQFSNDRDLRIVFVDERISVWRNNLPNADSPDDRVKQTIAYLIDKTNNDTRENALVLLLRVLADQTDVNDTRYRVLLLLVEELEETIRSLIENRKLRLKKRVALYKILLNLFDEELLEALCFAVAVNYGQLLGTNKATKIRDLLEHLELEGRLDDVMLAGMQLRPDISWAIDTVSEPGIGKWETEPDQPQRDFLSRTHLFEPELIHIPSGEFLMGSDPREDADALGEEQPQHRLFLPDYYLSKTPVTNAQYFAFARAVQPRHPAHWDGPNPPKQRENYPVVNVSWYDALDYCHWLTDVTGKPFRLPTEAEWEKGARGADKRRYPWGNYPDATRCNVHRDPSDYSMAELLRIGVTEDAPVPVDAYPEGASPYGLLNMAGNVWEWTSSLWGSGGYEPEFKYPYDADDGRENLVADDEVHRVLRGGAFNASLTFARCACRNHVGPRSFAWYVGFRVAVSAD